jgi:hypothetical protein
MCARNTTRRSHKTTELLLSHLSTLMQEKYLHLRRGSQGRGYEESYLLERNAT